MKGFTLLHGTAQGVALAPLGVCVFRWWQDRRTPLDGWLVASAFAVSFVADTWSLALPWTVATVLYPVLQFGLLFLVLDTRRAVWWTAVVAGGAVASVLLFGQGTPDLFGWVVGAGLVTWLALTRLQPSALRTGVLVYFAGGLLFRPGFGFEMADRNVFLAAWVGYQCCRVVGLSLVSFAFGRAQWQTT